MKKVYFSLLIFGLIFLTGCGGGGTTSTSKSEKYEVKTVNVSKQDKVNITRDNALSLFDLASEYTPTDMGLRKDDIVEAISQGIDRSISCEYSGSMTIKTSSARNNLILEYSNCYTDQYTGLIEGSQIIAIDNYDDGEEGDYFIGKNLKVKFYDRTIQYSYTIKSYNDNGLKKWDYYVKVTSGTGGNSLEFNLYVTQDVNNMISIDGVYLLDNGTYFELKSENLRYQYMSWFGFDTEISFDRIVANSNAKISILGEESYFNYWKVYDEHIIALTTNSNEVFYRNMDISKDNLGWHTSIVDVVKNLYDPNMSIIVNGKSLHKYFGYNIKVYSPKLFLDISSSDSDTYSKHNISVTLLEKPPESRLNLSEEYNDSEIISDKLALNVDYTFHCETIIQLDADGIYKFKVLVKDGDRTTSKEFYVDYENASLLDSQGIMDFNIKDSLYIDNIEKIAIITSKPSRKLLIMDTNGTIISDYNLSFVPHSITLNPNQTKLAISGDAKVALIDIFNIDNINMDTIYLVGGNLADIAMTNDYIYTIGHSGSFEYLYTIHINDGNVTKNDSFILAENSKLKINYNQNSLYVLNGISRIEKFDINSGYAIYQNGTYNYNYPYCDNMWMFSDSKILTACGTILTMDASQNSDMIYAGMYESSKLITNSYGNLETKIKSLHANQLLGKQVIIYGDNAYYNNFYGDNVYPSGIEIRNINGDNTILYDAVLSSYLQEDKLYRLFVEYSYLVADNRVFIIYRGVLNGNVDYDETKDIFIYELRDI